jgi:hypothetical protein
VDKGSKMRITMSLDEPLHYEAKVAIVAHREKFSVKLFSVLVFKLLDECLIRLDKEMSK